MVGVCELMYVEEWLVAVVWYRELAGGVELADYQILENGGGGHH